ncbi:MAG: nucleotide exchange factor GrpE [Alphaproteobacteria bacterium]|nr:nucleotide exchange factor GrpE [Alphaproteobacteria bacterium]
MSEQKPQTAPQEGRPENEAAPETVEELAALAEELGAGETLEAALTAAQAEIERLTAEAAEQKDRALRALAEMENLRRRTEREREDIQKYAISRFAKDLLSVADSLRRALEQQPKNPDEATKGFIDGIAVTERELLSVFERHQVRPIEALGQKFDANFHEAVFEMEDPSKPAGTVTQVMQTGYTIAGRLLRAAMVAVSKGGARGAAQSRVDTQA